MSDSLFMTKCLFMSKEDCGNHEVDKNRESRGQKDTSLGKARKATFKHFFRLKGGNFGQLRVLSKGYLTFCIHCTPTQDSAKWKALLPFVYTEL